MSRVDHPKKEEQGDTRVEKRTQKIEVHQNSGSPDMDIFSSSKTQKLYQQPDNRKYEWQQKAVIVTSCSPQIPTEPYIFSVRQLSWWIQDFPHKNQPPCRKAGEQKPGFPFWKMRPQTTCTPMSCLHLLCGWSHKCQKELKEGKHNIIDNFYRNNNLTDYHDFEFQQNKGLFCRKVLKIFRRVHLH